MISDIETLDWVNKNILQVKNCYNQIKLYLSEESIAIMENQKPQPDLNLSNYQHCITGTVSTVDFIHFAESINENVANKLIEGSAQTQPSLLKVNNDKTILFFFSYSRHSIEYLKSLNKRHKDFK